MVFNRVWNLKGYTVLIKQVIVILVAGYMALTVSYAQTTFTSVQTGDWNDGATWGNTSPGTQGTDWPANTDNAVIADGTVVKLTAARTINDLTINDGGEFHYDGFVLTLSGTVTPAFVSDQSGDWDDANTWLGSPGTPSASDKVIVSRDHTVLLTGNETIDILIINSGGIVDDNNVGDLTITTRLLLNGERQGKKSTELDDGATLDGLGNHYSTKEVEVLANASVTIAATANLSISGDFKMNGGGTVTNYGAIVADEIKDKNTSDTWINEAGSSLTALKDIMGAGGTLTATATGNTVTYAEQNTTNITIPSSNTYYNLVIAGSNTKTLISNLTITGDLTISSILDTDAGNNYTLDIEGNWYNTGSFVPNNSTVTFNGSGDQTIDNSSGESFYDLTINKASGTMNLAGDVTVTNTLTMTAGNIDTGVRTLTLGDATTNEGTLSRTTGTVIGAFERWIAAGTTGNVTFPIGSSSIYAPAEPAFTDGSKTGGTVTMTFVDTYPTNDGLSLVDGATTVYNTFVEGYWTLGVGNGFDPGTGFDLDLNGAEMTSFAVKTSTRILRRSTPTNGWITEGTHVNAVGNVAQRTGLTNTTTQFALADDTNCTPPETFAITGDTEVCTGDSDGYSVALNSGNTYYWTVTGGLISGSTTASGVDLNSVTVDWDGTGQVGTLEVYEQNTCTRSAGSSITVNVNTLPTSEISGSTNVAENQTAVPYSVDANAGYTYTWTITGGTQSSGGTTNSIEVDWGDAGIGTVSVVASSTCPADAAAVSLNAEIYSNILSVQSGDWDDPDTWDCNCDPTDFQSVNILDGHRVTLTGDETVQNVSLESGGVIDQNDKKFKINGNLLLNGTITGNTANNKQIELKGGSGTVLDGTGSINSQGSPAVKFKGDIIIASSADLLFIGDLEIDNRRVVTNYGMVTVNDPVVADGAESVWLNEENSTLKIGGEVFATDGILRASATGNMVEYAATSGTQDITTPQNGTYYNLMLSGAATYETQDDLTILGDLTISSGIFDVAANNNDLTIEGDWMNTGTFTEGTHLVTFTGTNEQTISKLGGETFYNVTTNKSSGSITIDADLTISNAFTMTAGNIETAGNKVILGTSAANEGTLTYSTGIIVGAFERWVDNATTSQLLFPIGTSEDYRGAEVTFSDAGKTDGTVIFEFIQADPGSSGLSLVDGAETIYNTFVEGYWDVAAGNSFAPGTSFDLELYGNGFTSFTIAATTRLLTRANAVSNWTAEGTHVDAVSPKAKRTGLSTFGAQYAFGDNTNCTPPGAPTFTGVTEVCKGDNGDTYTITSSTAGLTDYIWSAVGGSIAGGQGTGTVTINWDNVAQVGSVGLQVVNSCTTSDQTDLSVNVNTITPSDISGDLIVPENETGVVYSVDLVADHTYVWTVNGGTFDGASSGLGVNSVTVDWGTAGTGTLSVTAQKTGCSVSDQVSVNVNKYVVIESIVATGDWTNANSWDCTCVPGSGDNPRIKTGHTITLDDDITVNNFSVDLGGAMDMDNNDRTLTITGNLTVNGSISVPTASTALDIVLSGVGASITGAGSINPTNVTAGSIQVSGGNKTIGSTAVLTISDANLEFGSSSISVTNNGDVTLALDLVGQGDGTNNWTNASGSTLMVGGALLTDGTLYASASGNTVDYNGTGAQNIKLPNGSDYHSLSVSGSGTKTAPATLDIAGSVALNGTAVLDVATNNADLTVAGDWTNAGGTFTEGTRTVTLDGSLVQTITGSETFYNLTINNSVNDEDAITVANDVNISGVLTMTDGIVGTGANVVTVTNTATTAITGASSASFVNGILARQTATAGMYDFPVGDGTTYKRVGLLPENGTASTFQVQGFQSAYSDVTNKTGLTNVSTMEYWDISRTVGADNVIIRLYWNTQGASGITSATDLLVGHYTGGQWTSIGNGLNSGDTDPGWIESASYVSSFSPFTFASNSSGSNPLPVEFMSFTAQWDNGSVLLEWETASEIDNERFDVERSTDGENFAVIGSVDGGGTTNEHRQYWFVDKNPVSGISYYRLRQVDFDGKEEHSAVISIEGFVQQREFGVTLAHAQVGNPNVLLRLESDDGVSPVFVTIWDALGREIFVGRADYVMSSGTLQLNNVQMNNAGLYLLRVRQGLDQVVIKFQVH